MTVKLKIFNGGYDICWDTLKDVSYKEMLLNIEHQLDDFFHKELNKEIMESYSKWDLKE